MGVAVRDRDVIDWARTALGPRSAWPEPLAAAADLISESLFPSFLCWGPELLLVYNDALAALVGPAACAQGERLRDGALPLSACLGRVVTRALAGKAVRGDDAVLPVEMDGAVRQTRLSYSCSPIRDDVGRAAGVLVVLVEAGGEVAWEPAAAAERGAPPSAGEQREAEDELGVMTRLRDFAARLSATDEMDALLKTVLDAAIKLHGADFGHVQLVDQETRTLRLMAHHGLSADWVAKQSVMSIDDPHFCAARALRSGARLMIEDVRKDKLFAPHRAAARAAGFLAVQSTPIFDRGKRPVAVVSTHFRAPHVLSPREERITDLHAGQAADAIVARLASDAVQESEERFRHALDVDTVGVLFFEIDGSVTDANGAFLRMTGYSRKDLGAGTIRWDAMTPPEWLPPSQRAAAELAVSGRTTPYEREYVRKDGSRRWGLFAARRIGPTSAVEYLIDVTESRRAQEEHATSEWRLRLLMEGIPQLVWRSIAFANWTWSSPQWTAYTGLSDRASQGRGWLNAVHPDDRARAIAAWDEASMEGEFEIDYRLLRASDREYRWFRTRAAVVRAPDGAIIEWLGTSTDIHDMRRLQEEQRLLVAELQHRTRNLIAVVRSIARQTMDSAEDTADFRDRFNDRLAALARAQGLLSRTDMKPITIGDLIHMELDALGAEGAHDRVTVDGPEVVMRNSSVQTLALAVHELATNARKYGALAASNGRLAVRWRIEEEEGGAGDRLVIDWRESGVTVKAAPAANDRGYGRELIERALPYQLSAETSLDILEDGVHCRIALPVELAVERRLTRRS